MSVHLAAVIAWWALIAFHAQGGFFTILNVGKERDGLTPGVAAFATVMTVGVILLIVFLLRPI